MAGLFGILIACDVLENPEERLLKFLKIFFGLIFVSGFTLAYLTITTALQSGIPIPNGTYHILGTKIVLLMGLGHLVMVGSKKNMPRWTSYSLVIIAITTFLGLLLRGY
jgi:hypothetical protein